MPTDEFTLACVYEPAAWPPPSDCLIGGWRPAGKCHVSLYALRDGRMRAEVTDAAGNAICEFVSQPIESPPPCRLRIILVWSPQDGVRLYLNNVVIMADAAGVGAARLPAPPPAGPEVPASLHPDAAANCQTWVDNRRAKFATPPNTKPGRRPKTVAEQGEDLSRSAGVLRSLSEQAAKGAEHLLGPLAGEIRALVYWGADSQPDRQYNPLLLRMASLADLPLPVYFPKDRGRPPGPGLSLAVQLKAMSLTAPITTGLQLGDIQEWLSRPSFYFGATGAPLPPKALVSETANTLGAAHYDADMPESVAMMREVVGQNTDALVYFLRETADVLASLAEGVLSELRSRGVLP